MRQVSFILVALLLTASAMGGVKRPGTPDVEPQRSAALFVGIRDFDHDELTKVQYAIDDAVDLAYEFAVNHDPILVPPNRIVLALSDEGEPQKPESQWKLKRLLGAGACRQPATRSNILRLLDEQSKRVGRNGILIVSFATHGVSHENQQHLLTRASRLNPVEATVTVTEVGNIVWDNEVPRSLILIDACRQRLTSDRRAGTADPRSRFIKVMSGVDGQVIISGAPIGGYAYDDDVRRNGVFTATVIDGLQCGAAKDWHHFVTVETLYSYVSREVVRWVNEKKNSRARRATQLFCEGQMRKMPLSICVNRTASASSPHRE